MYSSRCYIVYKRTCLTLSVLHIQSKFLSSAFSWKWEHDFLYQKKNQSTYKKLECYARSIGIKSLKIIARLVDAFFVSFIGFKGASGTFYMFVNGMEIFDILIIFRMIAPNFQGLIRLGLWRRGLRNELLRGAPTSRKLVK